MGVWVCTQVTGLNNTNWLPHKKTNGKKPLFHFKAANLISLNTESQKLQIVC